MAKVLVLAKSGFGKSTSIGHIPELEIKGLEPKKTYVISCTSKPLPFRGSNKDYPIAPFNPKDPKTLSKGRRVISNNPGTIATALTALVKSPFENIVVDDKLT